jgi:hypothetical protein
MKATGDHRAPLLLAALAALAVAGSALAGDDGGRPRLLVLTDIGGDPDDQQSLIRLLVYSNEFEVEGLVASASGTPGELGEKVTRPDLIRQKIEAYREVYPNLTLHARGYPEPGALLDRVKSGNPDRGVSAVGEGHDSEGSGWIVRCADRDDPRPLNIVIWGGQTDLCQALWRVRHDRGPDGVAAFVARLRVHDIDDQDQLHGWLSENFPDLVYVLSKSRPGRDKREGAYRGMYLGGDESLTSREWVDRHVRSGHGPLGALYPVRTWTDPNPHGVLKEGDTPSWFYFLPNGLGDPGRPGWGGWGGRFRNERAGLFRDAEDTVDGTTEARATVWRWRAAFQNDFAARMDWCASNRYQEANHNPAAVLNGDLTPRPVLIGAEPGESVRLSAAGTTDPDGDALEFRWWVYAEAGNSEDVALLVGESPDSTSLVAPGAASPVETHVVLEVRDGGSPPLTAYRRAVITVTP